MSTVSARFAGPPYRVSGLFYGLGLGGFVDGIVLHQILQWHHMVSDVGGYPVTTVAGLEANTLADGFFHVATWLLVFVASLSTIAAWRQGRVAPNWSFHLGLVLAGWGLFNVVEGLVDHQLLGLHHVRDDLAARSRGISASSPWAWSRSSWAGGGTSGGAEPDISGEALADTGTADRRQHWVGGAGLGLAVAISAIRTGSSASCMRHPPVRRGQLGLVTAPRPLPGSPPKSRRVVDVVQLSSGLRAGDLILAVTGTGIEERVGSRAKSSLAAGNFRTTATLRSNVRIPGATYD